MRPRYDDVDHVAYETDEGICEGWVVDISSSGNLLLVVDNPNHGPADGTWRRVHDCEEMPY